MFSNTEPKVLFYWYNYRKLILTQIPFKRKSKIIFIITVYVVYIDDTISLGNWSDEQYSSNDDYGNWSQEDYGNWSQEDYGNWPYEDYGNWPYDESNGNRSYEDYGNRSFEDYGNLLYDDNGNLSVSNHVNLLDSRLESMPAIANKSEEKESTNGTVVKSWNWTNGNAAGGKTEPMNMKQQRPDNQ